jgi:Leucine-rich repeat (LRR) protein
VCRGSLRDLDGTFKFIPRLPATVQALDFSWNCLQSLHDPNFFRNVTQLQRLELSYNCITWVAPGAFDLMPNLTELLIENNWERRLNHPDFLRNVLNAASLHNVMATTSLKYVSFDIDSRVQDIFADSYIYRQSVLRISDGLEDEVDLSGFCNFQELLVLELTRCNIDSIVINCKLNVRELILQNTGLADFPRFCDDNGTYMLPYLEYLDLSRNLFFQPEFVSDCSDTNKLTDACAPRLKFLDISRSTADPRFIDCFMKIHP